ncbi:cell wall-binding repeat-containing protein [Sutcliffiella deserti]|uniref:cell wall-binding repeat-containing protein n=1 Tax=Sutcliffiella deserti TaxID=2875501 RepID=UPI001CC0149E|nr:cell wall-binding repeat-containing protein [Sutcliffiella deserti]
MIRKSLVGLNFCLVLMLMVTLEIGFAEKQIVEYETNLTSAKTITLVDYELNIKNGETSYVDFIHSGEKIGELEFDFARVSNIFTWQIGETPYVLIEAKLDGTGGFARYSVYELNNKELEQLLLTEDYPAGSVEVKEDSFVITYYQENDSSSLASYQTLKDVYTQENDGSIGMKEKAKEDVVVKEISKMERISIQSNDDLRGTNPSVSEMNALLTSEAIKAGVPPELVKAIAWQESAWRQYRTFDDPYGQWKKGDPVISFDGGIGLMQITEPNMTAERARRLKTDIVYNIQEGLKILKDKWTYSNWGRIPSINGNDMQVIEDWYFAVMAYNGISRRNDPLYYPGNTYQDVIYRHIENFSQLITTPFPEQLLRTDIYYTSAGSLQFRNPHYHINGPYQTSKHLFKNGEFVRATDSGVRLRNSPEGTEIRKTQVGEALQIVGPYQTGNINSNHFVWYPVKDMNSNQIYYISSSYIEEMRISGDNRYATAVKVSREGWDKANVAVIARGDDFPDALAGTPLAYQLNAPILLTRSNELVEETKKELQRLGVKKIVMLGGPNAINTGVETSLRNLGLEVERIAGTNRYETAKLIANKMGTSFSTVVVANGKGFADALAIAPYAARNGIPILLSEKSNIPGPTTTLLANATNTIVVGGREMLADNLLKGMPKPVRIFGANRYETAYKIGTEFNFSASTGLVVNGTGFADALTGSVLAAKRNAPLLLVKPDQIPAETSRLVKEKDFGLISVLGGDEAIRNEVIRKIIE